ncbi:dimethylsulfoniopropionate cleavage enzyme DddD [Bradyrhizobium macuxiense]|uniref:Dimethylsulfoniopropionate cleavage enzyme DddD n=1 Tax=Bradyrhizobium macuxiense TaxID=1755647 RepID=A0A560MCL6_9BRAD|nr:CoA transferase [Bradyrhizobium macuxiense]TWC05344.1 dimethylsulfoniopropionate cleavage enzyme DddD [Bradyrhizobium macuxiense]
MKSKVAPLEGVRVLNLGGGWAGRVAAMLLADQGAEVLEIKRPDRECRLEDALLERGKAVVTLDFRDTHGRERAQSLARGADIVIDNLGPGRAAGFGLDDRSIRARNPALVYVSIPGFAEGSPLAHTAAWEGTVAASVGVYTDIHALGPLLGGPPIFTAVPMASAYGGVHAAIAAVVGFAQRLKTGRGERIEVPLADAVLSAMALLIMKVDGQPRRFDLPPIDKAMTEVAFPILRQFHDEMSEEQHGRIRGYLATFGRPQFGNHRCSDGRYIFINAVDHVHHAKACLEVLGLLNDLIAEGMTVGSPYEEGGEGNNISYSAGLRPAWVARLKSAMSARFLTKPAQEWEGLLRKAGVPATVVRSTDEWLDVPEALAGGNVADLEDQEYGPVRMAGRYVSIEGSAITSPALRSRRMTDRFEWSTPRLQVAPTAEPPGKMLSGLRVLDLSNVIAGPAAARILAEFGADVIRIDPPAPQAGPRMTMWFGIDVNQGKRAIVLDLKSAEGRSVLEKLVRQSDVVIHNFLDRSAEKIGISDQQLRQINPDIISCQVSAWGGPHGGPFKDDPAFDPVLQAATGITQRYGTKDAPVLHGIASCVDYITGFSAALGIAQTLVSRQLGRGGAHVRTSLSMGAQLVQFPFTVASERAARIAEPSGQQAAGYGVHYQTYRTRDGWAFLACRARELGQVAGLLGATEPTEGALSEVIAGMTCMQAADCLRSIKTASIVPVRRLDELRACATLEKSEQFQSGEQHLAMLRTAHPSGYQVSLPLPTWYRLQSKAVEPLSAAHAPGSHTRSVLAEFGLSDAEVDGLLTRGVARESWSILKHYLPH